MIENKNNNYTKMEKVLHISHTDLDGTMPIILNNMVVHFCDKFNISIPRMEYETKQITPPELIKVLENTDLIQSYDKIIITDLRITGESLLKIIDYGIEKFYIADHHPIEFDLEASVRSFEKYKSWSREQILDHIVISDTFDRFVFDKVDPLTFKTCGTELYWEFFIGRWFNELIGKIKNEIASPIKISTTINIDLTHTKVFDNISRIVGAVRLWDTYEWHSLSESSLGRTWAERLQILFLNIDKTEFENYLIDYMYLGDLYNFTYDLFVDSELHLKAYKKQCELPINYIINRSIDEKNSYIKEMVDPKNKRYQIFTWEINTPSKKMSLNAALIFSNKYNSEIANLILEQESDIDIAVIINNKNVQLRSLDHLANCGEIAKLYGGGGHHNAAGFIPLPQDRAWMERNFFLGLCNLCSDIKRTGEE